MLYYTCTGPVRGDCGHHHKTPQTAGVCYQRDDRACSKQGGHSDRRVVAVVNGRRRELTDAEFEVSFE